MLLQRRYQRIDDVSCERGEPLIMVHVICSKIANKLLKAQTIDFGMNEVYRFR